MKRNQGILFLAGKMFYSNFSIWILEKQNMSQLVSTIHLFIIQNPIYSIRISYSQDSHKNQMVYLLNMSSDTTTCTFAPRKGMPIQGKQCSITLKFTQCVILLFQLLGRFDSALQHDWYGKSVNSCVCGHRQQSEQPLPMTSRGGLFSQSA